jgi:hypothetical protein
MQTFGLLICAIKNLFNTNAQYTSLSYCRGDDVLGKTNHAYVDSYRERVEYERSALPTRQPSTSSEPLAADIYG